MKRLRNIAVRMRPPAPYDDDGLPPPAREAPSEALELPKPIEVSRPASMPLTPEAEPAVSEPAPSRPQIWDIDQEDTHTSDEGPQAKRALSVPVWAPVPRAAAPVGRAKTRVLGFADPNVPLDPLAGASAARAPKAGPEEPRFAAGWLVVIEGPGRGADFAVTNAVSTIGRDPDQAICLDFGDNAISRQSHASVVYDAEQNRFFVGHGGKSNIVRHNGQPVLATEELHDGDHIRIGKTTLFFKALCGPDFTWGPDETADGGPDD